MLSYICLYQPVTEDPLAEFLEANIDILQAIHEAQEMQLPDWAMWLWVELA